MFKHQTDVLGENERHCSLSLYTFGTGNQSALGAVITSDNSQKESVSMKERPCPYVYTHDSLFLPHILLKYLLRSSLFFPYSTISLTTPMPKPILKPILISMPIYIYICLYQYMLSIFTFIYIYIYISYCLYIIHLFWQNIIKVLKYDTRTRTQLFFLNRFSLLSCFCSSKQS